MTKHTDGPWSIERDQDGSFGIYGKREGYTCQIAEVFEEDMGDPLPAEANARLIAAAPELLAALEALMREFFPSPYPDDYPEWKDARCAIAKATGAA